MNFISKAKDYSRVCKALEEMRLQCNALRTQLNVALDEANKLRGKLDAAQHRLDWQSENIVKLSADRPEKRKYFTLALQKQLLDYIWEDEGKIHIRVVKAPGKSC